MKKKKLSILLNIATICLCVCAIAIGVYSVKNASLSVTGTVAFTAHDCKVDVTAYIYGDAVDSSNNASSTGTPRTEANKGTLGTWSGITDKTGSQTIDSSKNFYFSDMGESGEVEDITIVFTITNQSDFPVKAVIDNATSSTSSITFTDAGDFGVPATAGTISGTMPAKSNTCNLAIKLKLSKTTESSNSYSISLSFEKYTPATNLNLANGNMAIGESKSEARTYLTMGKLSDSSTAEDMKWFIFAQSDSSTGAMKPVTSALSSTTLSAGTYWFISEYVLDKQNFKSSTDSNTYDYNTSDIKEYLNNGYLTNHALTNNTIYNSISSRTLKDDNDGDSQTDPFATVENQKLWLLSVNELSYLCGAKASSNFSSTNLMATSPDSSYTDWYLRTPSNFSLGKDMVFWVNSGSSVSYTLVYLGLDVGEDIDDKNSVRPAFQITI